MRSVSDDKQTKRARCYCFNSGCTGSENFRNKCAELFQHLSVFWGVFWVGVVCLFCFMCWFQTETHSGWKCKVFYYSQVVNLHTELHQNTVKRNAQKQSATIKNCFLFPFKSTVSYAFCYSSFNLSLLNTTKQNSLWMPSMTVIKQKSLMRWNTADLYNGLFGKVLLMQSNKPDLVSQGFGFKKSSLRWKTAEHRKKDTLSSVVSSLFF